MDAKPAPPVAAELGPTLAAVRQAKSRVLYSSAAEAGEQWGGRPAEELAKGATLDFRSCESRMAPVLCRNVHNLRIKSLCVRGTSR